MGLRGVDHNRLRMQAPTSRCVLFDLFCPLARDDGHVESQQADPLSILLEHHGSRMERIEDCVRSAVHACPAARQVRPCYGSDIDLTGAHLEYAHRVLLRLEP